MSLYSIILDCSISYGVHLYLDLWNVNKLKIEKQGVLLLYNVHIGSGAHPASYRMDAGASFPGGKAAGA
jgi:hypothetical protein